MLHRSDSGLFGKIKKEEKLLNQQLDERDYHSAQELMSDIINACNNYINDYVVFSNAHTNDAQNAVEFCKLLESDYQSSSHPQKGFIFNQVLQNFVIVFDSYLMGNAELSRLRIKWLDPVLKTFNLQKENLSATRKILEKEYAAAMEECKCVKKDIDGSQIVLLRRPSELLETLRQGVE